MMEVCLFPCSGQDRSKETIKNAKDGDSFFFIDDRELYVYFNGAFDGPSSDSLLNSYIIENLKIPESAVKNKIKGSVYVSFFIDSLGNVSEIKIEKGLTSEINNEIVRLIANMPKWEWESKLELKDRKKTRRTIPIRFELDKK
jgi:TonB family protein